MARRRSIETTTIDQVFRHTLATLQDGRMCMSEIAAAARAEFQRVEHLTRQLRADASPGATPSDRIEADLAQSSASLARMGERAEAMAAQASAAVELLGGNLTQLTSQLEGMRVRHQIGERVIRAQEEERRRVAREIHDGPAQAMANVVLRAEICERLFAEGRKETAQELSQLKDLVKDSLRELRKIIFDLRPMALDDLGLVPTLYRYLTNLREHEGVPVYLELAGKEVRLPPAVEVALFRLAQEAVNNARKHAQARRIDLRLDFGGSGVTLSVADNGVGFDLAAMQAECGDRESFGLMSMKERIDLVDGEFAVTSEPGRGTRIVARVPAAGVPCVATGT